MTDAAVDHADAARRWAPVREPVEHRSPIRSIRVPDADEWAVVGDPLRDNALRERVIAVLHRVGELPGTAESPCVGDGRDFHRVRAALDAAYTVVAARGTGAAVAMPSPAVARNIELLGEIGQLRVEVTVTHAAQRNARYAAVRNALSRLRGVDSVEQMIDRAPAELCRCGFDRAIISRVEESTWWVEAVHVKADAEWASDIVRAAREHPMLIDHPLIESEIMRRRAPVLVSDAQQDRRTNAVIGRVSLSRSYVAAPIMPDGRIIGLLHADCYNSRRHVDDEDMAVLWMFAEGFGYAYQRTALSERLRFARNEIQRMARDLASAADEVCTARTTLGRPRHGHEAAGAHAPVAASLAADSGIEDLLSRREIEVVSLMAQGKSNGSIATHLVISEGTVKTHVKHILRKLKASNRAEAVFRYMRMTAVHWGPPTIPRRPTTAPS